MSNLDILTTYNVRAYATNSIGTSYGNEETFTTSSSILPTGNQIIADHTIVDRFDDIPAYYMNEVKKMWLDIPGESHSWGYRYGLTDFASDYPAYAVSSLDYGAPEAYTTSHLRVSRATWGDVNNATGWITDYGEEDWFLTPEAIAQTKAGITYCNMHSLTIAAIGFAWCWDDNIMDMTDYLSATQQYADYCSANGYSTKVFFTTGPVEEFTGELAYNNSLRWKQIRDYVDAHPTTIFFDYADILCHDDAGILYTDTWNGHTFPYVSETTPEQAGHISVPGSIRLAKALWWMLARMAGWDGN
jgi:hypothetical protein